MNSLVEIHKILVELLLGVIIVNIAISLIYKNNKINLIKYSRIGFFLFWGAWAMTLFAGIIAFVLMGAKLTTSTIIMIIASIILPIIDGYRAIKLTQNWRENKKNSISISINLLIIELIIIALITIYTIIN